MAYKSMALLKKNTMSCLKMMSNVFPNFTIPRKSVATIVNYKTTSIQPLMEMFMESQTSKQEVKFGM